jgi:hypothetical protein
MSAAGLQHGTFEVFGFGAGAQNRMVVGLTADFQETHFSSGLKGGFSQGVEKGFPIHMMGAGTGE